MTESTAVRRWRDVTLPGTVVRIGTTDYRLTAADGAVRAVTNLSTLEERTANVNLESTVTVVYGDLQREVTGTADGDGASAGELAGAVVAARLGGEVLLARTADGRAVAPDRMTPRILAAHVRLMHGYLTGDLDEETPRALEAWHRDEHENHAPAFTHSHGEV